MAAQTALVARADTVRQQIENLSVSISTKTPRKGARRVKVRGYYIDGAPGRAERGLAWRHTTIYRRTGSTREFFTAFRPGTRKRTMWERRHDGQLTWLKLQNYQVVYATLVPTGKRSGYYAAGRYVRWNNKDYILPVPAPKP